MTPHEHLPSDLRASLRDMWLEHDPAPDDLADRVIAALAIDQSDLDLELMEMVDAGVEHLGVRQSGTREAHQTLRFDAPGVGLLLHLGPPDENPRQITGWVEPATAYLSLESAGERTPVELDANGRFECLIDPTFATRFRLRLGDSRRTLTTPELEW